MAKALSLLHLIAGEEFPKAIYAGNRKNAGVYGGVDTRSPPKSKDPTKRSSEKRKEVLDGSPIILLRPEHLWSSKNLRSTSEKGRPRNALAALNFLLEKGNHPPPVGACTKRRVFSGMEEALLASGLNL